jgi:octaprenyl-diphosphate synthase
MFTCWDEYHLINNDLAGLVRDLPPSDLGEVITYVLSSPGKRVRPLILILSAQAFGGTAPQAMNAALAIELVHAASLVHDDILDCGVERRGSPSTFERYGTDAALLAGDYLISRSIELISYYSQPVISCFAHACMSMSQGEMLDLSSACSKEDYYQCISKKTASLFAASARMGCLIASAPADDVSRFEQYGHHLGLAYQILDDLEEFMGVDQGKHSNKTSVTLPWIYSQLYDKERAVSMCCKAVEDHCTVARDALSQATGDLGMKARLEEIVDLMALKGLDRCKLQKSLC